MRIQPAQPSGHPPNKRHKNAPRPSDKTDDGAATVAAEPSNLMISPPGEKTPQGVHAPEDRDRALQLADYIRSQLATLKHTIAHSHDPRSYGFC